MLETAVAGVHFMCTILYYCFYFSYKTGQFLVTTINLLLQNCLIFAKNIFEFIIIILESFTIFSQDVVQCFQQVFRFSLYVVEVIVGSISTTLSDITNTIEALVVLLVAVYDFVVNSILNVVTVIGQTFIILKRVLILFGSGVWFSITFIPLLIVSLWALCTYYVGRLLEEVLDSISVSVSAVKNALKNFYEFLTDVPIESVAGIIVAICLVYILTQVYTIIYLYVYEQVRGAYQRINRGYHRLRGQQLPSTQVRITVRSRPQIKSRLNLTCVQRAKGGSSVDERYCVICQERVKCILVLPCRHVCMCNECSDRLQLYNNTCPICRNHIDSTMKIFV